MGKTQTRYEHWNGKIPPFAYHLRTWGEAGVVCLRDLKTAKIQDKGITCMFVGYSIQHPGNTYRMWDPNTSRIHTSRDIKWLNRMYFTNNRFNHNHKSVTSEAGKSDHNPDVDLNDENDAQSVNSETSTSETSTSTTTNINITGQSHSVIHSIQHG